MHRFAFSETSHVGCFYPNISYALPIWGFENIRTKVIFTLQKKAVRIICGLKHNETCEGVLKHTTY